MILKTQVTVSILLYTVEAVKRLDGRYNVKISVSHKGKCMRMGTDYYFNRDEWAEMQDEQVFKPPLTDKNERERIKFDLLKKREEVQETVNRVYKQYGMFSLGLFKEAMERGQGNNMELFALLNNRAKKNKEEKNISTYQIYDAAAKSLRKYMKVIDLPLVEVTPSFLETYYNRAKADLSDTTIAMYLTCVATVFNYCIDNGLAQRVMYPFGRPPKFPMPKRAKRKDYALSDEDMEIFKNAYVESIRQRFYLDLFLFSYYTFGLNIVDIMLLEKADVYNGFINTERRKTRKKSIRLMNLPIRKEAQALIDKYYHENSGYLFDIFHGDETPEQIHERAHAYSRRINKVLKDICTKHGINKRVTTYTARHTSANKMLSEGVKIEMISPLLGHTDIKTTQIYTQKLPASKTKDVIDNIAM